MRLENNSDINEYGLLTDLPRDDSRNQLKRQRYGAFTLIIVNFLLILVLFILYANVKTHKTVKNYTISTYSEMKSEDVIPSTSVGYGLSLALSGKTLLGAGTSIYKDIDSLTSPCPKYLTSDAMFDSNYLLSYYDSAQETSTIVLMELSNPRDTSVLSSSTFPTEVYDIATLNQETGVFVAINQDMDETLDTATVIAGYHSDLSVLSYFEGMVTSTNPQFTYGIPVVYGGQYSVDPSITRLSDDSFAIIYYDTNAQNTTIVVTRYGRVNPDLSITLSEGVVVGVDISNGIHYTAVGLTPTLYLIGYYNGTGSIELRTGPLSVMTVVIEDGAPVLGATSVLENKIAAFNLASDRVDDNSAIFTFADVSTNFGISSVLVSIDSVTGIANFGSSVVFSSGRTLSLVQTYLTMDLDVIVISRPTTSASNPSPVKFLVVYSDISNNGILTTAIGSISRSAELSQISPDFLLNSGNSNPDLFYTWATATIAGDHSEPDDIQVIFAHSMTPSTCALGTTSTLSVSSLQMKPSPFGIAITANSGPDTVSDVLVSGTFSISGNNLIPGAAYFSNSFGEIVGGDVMYGSDYTLRAQNYYYYDSNTETLIDSSSSLIGVAINSNTISLKLN